ncbi:Helix-turn-helix domain-containing protein [Amycolatopsis xylanica]|uniref:Helix-turn-helix domain-containing protein n=1 Tax=Amycolatopsis xylanica TaxID=589385 RepID=A0A1H3EY39_9PSEU|nr:helix-turn-helix transcriptional regulator [Amycolatopsis xylanica]SDX83722.1 Helix-turn-helix domain-containing protein [Amycolatopsis xylanica]
MTRGETPVGQLRRLRAVLKQEREQLGLTQRDVADALDWSSSKLIRIEKGVVGISITDLKALLLHYRITDADRVEALVELARAGKKPAWWQAYRDIYGQQFLNFLGLEASAVEVKQFQGRVIPGLLQTQEYATALMSQYHADPERVERGTAVRMRRQEIVAPDGPEMVFIMDEAVLRRTMGSVEVMRGQLLRLKEVAALSNIDVRVVPFSAGPHKGLASSFVLFRLSEIENDVVLLLEIPDQDILVEEFTDQTKDYIRIFDELEGLALTEDDSVKLIDKILAELGESS